MLLTHEIIQMQTAPSSPKVEVDWLQRKELETTQQASAFIPRIIQQGISNGSVTDSTSNSIVHECDAAVVFADASGFTALTERLATKPNGAELLSRCLNAFFTPLIEMVTAYQGDVIKFSGDALTILFEAKPGDCGSAWAGCQGHDPVTLAVLRASACCLELHKRLHNFDTGEGVLLTLHIGIGSGRCTILHLGGVVPAERGASRFECVIAGDPLRQIAIAEPVAKHGETVLSPEAWAHVSSLVLEGREISDLNASGFKVLGGINKHSHNYASIRSAAQPVAPPLPALAVSPRYIPAAVFSHIQTKTLQYVNEMRGVSVVFISLSGLDVATEPAMAQRICAAVQNACRATEGQLNKFMVDDKGSAFLCAYGLPPLVHTDDAARALEMCFAVQDAVAKESLATGTSLSARCGITTGRAFCGLVGSALRAEYTVMGDTVNTAARLMGKADPICCCDVTKRLAERIGRFSFEALEPMKLKGKEKPFQAYKPNMRKRVLVSSSEPDSLGKLESWEAGVNLRRLLNRGVGAQVFVFVGPLGLGKDILTGMVVSHARDSGSLIHTAVHEGRPGDEREPLLELLESIDAQNAHDTEGLTAPELLDRCETALKDLLRDKKACVVLRSTYGTSLFDKTENPQFWKLFERIGGLQPCENLTVVLQAETAPPEGSKAMLRALSLNTVLDIKPLSKACASDYLASLLGCHLETLPAELVEYVFALTDRYPLHIKETIEQLLGSKAVTCENGQVSVKANLENIKVAEWSYTTMVGRVVCQLETLDTQAASVVKLAAVFPGTFSVLDLAASLASQWGGARNIDYYRILFACKKLVKLGLLRFTGSAEVGSMVPVAPDAKPATNQDPWLNRLSPLTAEELVKDSGLNAEFASSAYMNQTFVLESVILRKVASAAILDTQRISIRRQSMLQRALGKELKLRIAEAARRRKSIERGHSSVLSL